MAWFETDFCMKWMTVFGKESGSLAQGNNRTREKGTDSLWVLSHQGIRDTPTDRVFIYVRLVVNHRPLKEDPIRV